MEILFKQLQVYLDSICEIKEELQEEGYDTSGMDLYIDGLYDEISELESFIKKNQ